MTANTALIARPGDLALAGPMGSLDAYLDRVSRIPVLTREEERDLAERFRVEIIVVVKSVKNIHPRL